MPAERTAHPISQTGTVGSLDQVFARIRTDAQRDHRAGPFRFLRGRARRLQQAQHRGLSQSGAGDPRDHRAGGRPIRRGDGEILHDSDGGRTLSDARRRQHPLDLVLRPVVRPRHLQVRRRLLLRADAGLDQPAAERQLCPAIRLPRSSSPVWSARSTATSSSGRRISA